jgi:phosphate uptake regulator
MGGVPGGRALFTPLKEKDWAHDVAAAADVALLGRFYERCADRAVEIGRRVVFQAAGEAPTCGVRESSRCDRHTFGASKVGKHVNLRLSF